MAATSKAFSPAQKLKTMQGVCERIAQGESLVSIAKRKDFPTYQAITAWLRKDRKEGESGELVAMYAQAREDQADFLADELVAIADNTDDPAKARVQIDTRKWIASKLKAKVYGDKIEANVTGGITMRLERGEPTE